MKKDQFNQIISDLKISTNKWVILNEIDSIILKNGKGFYPNWKHLRFQILDDSILVQHGDSVPYGNRLSNTFSISLNQMQISFPAGSVLSENSITFRLPKSGDILRINNKSTGMITYAIISNVVSTINKFVIYLSNPVAISNNTFLSFYDPSEYDNENCVHSDIIEGVYSKFLSNKGKHTKLGIKHEVIKIKDISEIKLKLVNKKTYSIKGDK